MVIESKPNINPVSHQQQEPPKSSTLENGLLLPNVPRNEAPTDTFNSVPERPVVNESKKKIASESCWATEDKGWQKDKSYKTLSGLEKFRYALKNLNQKISVFFNAFRQMLSWKGERSKKILTDLNEQERIDEQVVQSGGLSGPSATVKKLVDKEGVRAARLSSSDLTHLVLSIKAASKDRISVVDGYSMEQGGPHFLNVNKRKPSVKLKEEFDKKENKTILMPFVFPKKGLSEEHIVLIAVDPERKEIRYFDPKGAYSDDSARVGGFDDNPSFNMRDDLCSLQRELGDDWEIKENTKAYQRDATNCGTYVALAMQDEAEGKPVGQDWQTGLSWVNGQKQSLAEKVWDYYKNKDPLVHSP